MSIDTDHGIRRFGRFNSLGTATLASREIRRFLNVWAQTVMAPLINAALFLLIFTIAIGPRRGDVMGIADSTASACAAATSASCRMSSASAAAAAAARTSSAAAAVAAAIDLRRRRSAKSSASKWYELARCTLLLLLNIVWSQRSSQDSRSWAYTADFVHPAA